MCVVDGVVVSVDGWLINHGRFEASVLMDGMEPNDRRRMRLGSTPSVTVPDPSAGLRIPWTSLMSSAVFSAESAPVTLMYQYSFSVSILNDEISMYPCFEAVLHVTFQSLPPVGLPLVVENATRTVAG